MDSKVVSKCIRNIVWPCLKPLGFSGVKGRTAWRVWSHGVDVVNFQSFNSYLAGGVGSTTYSFAVNLGIHFDYISPVHGRKDWVSGDGLLLPKEYQCEFRSGLEKTIPQDELPRKGIWFVREDGSNVEEMVDNARDVILHVGLPWFERFRDPHEVLRTLIDDREKMEGGTYGFGNNPSPIRAYMLGYVSKHLGDSEGASHYFQRLMESGKMPYVHDRLKEELKTLS